MTARAGKRPGLLALCLAGVLVFGGLGVWQVQRLGWKRGLIARVESRIHLPPTAVPAAGQWPGLDLRDAEYRRVQVSGEFLHDRETLVDALTVLGPGAWVLTPLQTGDGVILVNRGFVPPELRPATTRAISQWEGEVTVTGLLRLTEPRGRILRSNRPEAGRWFSRDVAAIARARSLQGVAPFFIDADAGAGEVPGPVGGLTVVQFRNAHLTYAITWFALAGLCAAGFVLAWRREGAADAR